jgi:hypothetical protein
VYVRFACLTHMLNCISAVMSEIEEANSSLHQNSSWHACKDTITYLYSVQEKAAHQNYSILTSDEQLRTLSRLPVLLRNVLYLRSAARDLIGHRCLMQSFCADQTALWPRNGIAGTWSTPSRSDTCGLSGFTRESVLGLHVCYCIAVHTYSHPCKHCPLTVPVVYRAEKNAQKASVILFVINAKIASGSDKKVCADTHWQHGLLY